MCTVTRRPEAELGVGPTKKIYPEFLYILDVSFQVPNAALKLDKT